MNLPVDRTTFECSQVTSKDGGIFYTSDQGALSCQTPPSVPRLPIDTRDFEQLDPDLSAGPDTPNVDPQGRCGTLRFLGMVSAHGRAHPGKAPSMVVPRGATDQTMLTVEMLKTPQWRSYLVDNWPAMAAFGAVPEDQGGDEDGDVVTFS